MKKYNKKQLKKIIKIQKEVIDDLRLGKKYLDDKNDQRRMNHTLYLTRIIKRRKKW